ncbi:MAG: glycosyltransferase family 4 protein [Planctomycetota bacterium]
MSEPTLEDALIMAPSYGRRFSGINATMEAVIPTMAAELPIACCGRHLSDALPKTSLWRWLRSPNRAHPRVWHARRNNDMLVGIFLKSMLRQNLKLLFTSAAQRHHTTLTRWCYQRMDAVVATTSKAASYLRCDSVISHHGIDCDTYHPPYDREAMKASLGIQCRPTLAVFGRVRPQKGTCDFVKALLAVLPRFDEWQVLFVGATTRRYVAYQRKLEQDLESANLHDRVLFKGFVREFSDMQRWYQSADVIGCVSRNEGFGLTCLEGMASGAPVLATKAGAWDDIITDGVDGWIAEASDPTDLARALYDALATPAKQRSQMGRKARETVLRSYQVQSEADRLASVYCQLLGCSREQLAHNHVDAGQVLRKAA